MEENTRLSDLTRMLLSSPSFSGFLDTLSQNPQAAQMAQAPVKQQQQQQQQPNTQVRKDVNPHAAQQQMNQQQIGMTMIPEQHMDFSMLEFNNDSFIYQPQVFSVISMPETLLDAEALSGKSSLPPTMASDDEKVEIPVMNRTPIVAAPVEAETEVIDEEFDAKFALFASSPTTTSKPTELNIPALLASIPTKPVQYTLIVDSVNEDAAEAAMRKVERLGESIDRMADMLKSLTVDL